MLPRPRTIEFDQTVPPQPGRPPFKGLFPHCELGMMPPFGNLFGLPTYVAEELTEDEEIAFPAGSATEVIRLAYKDWARLVWPHLLLLRITV